MTALVISLGFGPEPSMNTKLANQLLLNILGVFGAAAFLALPGGCTSCCKDSSPAPRESPACFVFTDVNPGDEFVIKLTDPARIAEARAILSGKQKGRAQVGGTIVKSKARYNAGWSYHLAPESIKFFRVAMGDCDATRGYVDQQLSEVGGAFLPKNHWCPRASKLVRELPAESNPPPSK
jgi:hypothetical protein